MKVYVTHSSDFDYKAELYQPLREIQIEGVEFVFPHKDTDQPTNSKERIKEFDLVLAEVSSPSTGVGIELGWADMIGVPVVCIHKQGTGPSLSLQSITREIIQYTDAATLKEAVTKFLT